MTRQLLLLRHAKSSQDNPSLDDHNRPLNKRGQHAAKIMASYLKQADLKPGLVLCSTAERARRTLDPIQDIWLNIIVNFEGDLYLASVADTLSLLRRSGSVERILVLGHNPTMEATVHYLMDRTVAQISRATADISSKYPTGALAVMELDIESWGNIKKGCGRLTHFIKPRDLEDKQL